MVTIKNGEGKTVCKVDATTKVIEIVKKCYKKIIIFLPDDTYKVENVKVN